MKIILIQNIKCDDSNLHNTIYKLFDSNVIPHKGDYINDSIWKDPYQYEVCEVVLDYAQNRCEVIVEEYKEKWDTFDHFMDMAKMHNWVERYPINC